MSKDIVYTIKELELEKCIFTKPVLVQDKDKRNYYKGDIFINDHKSFIIQTPKLKLRNTTDYSIDLLVSRNKDRDREFYKVISYLEDILVNNMSHNSQEWFNKKLSKDQIELYLMKSCIKCPLNIEEQYVIKLEKTCNSVNFSPNDSVVCLIKVDGLIVSGTSVKLDLKIVHAKIIPNDIEKFSHVSNANESVDRSIGFPEAQSQLIADKKSIMSRSVNVPCKVEQSVQSVQSVQEEQNIPVEEIMPVEVPKTQEEIENIKFEYMKASINNDSDFMEKNKSYWEVST